MKLVNRFTQDQSGVAALIFALAAPATLIGAGAAIAYGEVRMVRTAEQSALDAAVLSGAGLPAGTTDAARIAAAQVMFDSQMSNFTPRLTQSVSATFTIQPIAQDTVKVTGTAKAAFANPFGAFMGAKTLTVGTSAAAQTSTSPPICVYALNNRANGAVDLNGTVNVSVSCAVQANSGSGSAVRAVGGARMSTSTFGVNGNYKGSGFTPPPKTGAAQLPDPFASLPFPAAGACTALSGTTIKANTTISPGTYCGGLKISSGAVVTMNPGIYLFTDGDFKVDSGAQVTGSEVMLAFDGKGAKFWMTGSAVMKITSPASGTYMNMQFMENRNNPAGNTWVSVGGNSQLQYDGIMYFPTSNIWVFGGSIVNGNSPTASMVGDKLWFQDNSTITLTQSNPRSLPVKDLSQRVGAVLIQ
jgi:Flp pilus assembly protein TadG